MKSADFEDLKKSEDLIFANLRGFMEDLMKS